MNRRNSELQFRNISNPDFLIPSSFEKNFLWSRSYDLSYNLTKGLKIDFSALNSSRVDEPLGSIKKDQPGYEARRDTILQNILDGGRNIHYHHTLNGSYTIPINKIPLLNWINSTVSYQGSYDWDAAPITKGDFELGNIIRNSRALQGNGRLDFTKIYNKVPYLKKVNQQYSGRGRGRSSAKGRPQSKRFIDDGLSLKADSPKSIYHKLGTKTVTVKVTDKKGKIVSGKTNIVNKNKITFTADEAQDEARILVTGTIEQNENSKVVARTSRFLMMVRNINISYTSTEGTVLPGYLPDTRFFGMSTINESATERYSMAPGWPFVLGHQDPNFVRRAITKEWITTDSVMNQPFLMTQNTALQLKSDIEPIPGLKITVNANRTKSKNNSEFYIYDELDGWAAHNRNFSGNYSMTIISIGSSFEKIGKNGVQQSDSWDNFQKYRKEIAWRLAGTRIPNSDNAYNPGDIDEETGFPDGYGPTSPEVLIPAFFAAYSDNDPQKVSLDPFPSLKFIMPNWQARYNGAVKKIPGLKGLMKTMGMSHSYRSTYNVGSYLSNLNYAEGNDGFSYTRDHQNNFIPLYDIAAISINETFNPLFDIDVTWINNLTTRLEFRKARNLTLSLANNQATEVYNSETSLGLGYRFENMKLFIKTKNSQKAIDNDLHLMADLQFSKNKTVLRKLVEENDQVTSGQDGLSLKVSADYNLSNVLMLRLFYDRVINTPYISLSYPSANTNIGVSFRLTLNQF
jgi:cell surface protein SprA